MLKSCEACQHPERAAVEEALSRGESYRELTKRFRVSVGQLKRHRKWHTGREDLAEPAEDVADRVLAETDESEEGGEGEECYLRLGLLPKGGLSFNTVEGEYEEGISVYSARKTPGGYRFDIPCEERYAPLCLTLLSLTLDLRPVFEADGTFVDDGLDNEPLLEDVTLKPVSPITPVEMPRWWGSEGKRYPRAWSRQRRRAQRRGSGQNAWDALEKEALDIMVMLQSVLLPRSPLRPFEDKEEQLRLARQGFRRNRALRAGRN